MTYLQDTTATFAEMDVNDPRAVIVTEDNASKRSHYLTDTTNPSSTYPKIITLDVGGRAFKVSHDILLESGLFKLQFSDRYTWTPEPDGSYFLDADPELFAHLLRFMRRPSVYPLFYNKVTGFDYDLYNRLEIEAEYFQLDGLHTWIQAKKYLQAVTVKTSEPVTHYIDDVDSTSCQANKWVNWHVLPQPKKRYVCPRGIYVHRGNPGRCGAACAKAQGAADDEYEEVAQVVCVENEIVFDEKTCRTV